MDGNHVDIAFRPLALADLPMLREWLNRPHVHEWWGVDSGPGSLGGEGPNAATAEQVHAKYAPEIEATSPRTHRFVIVVDGADVGLVQHYSLADFAGYAAQIGETAPGAAGIDLFIGEHTLVGRGIGGRVLDAFVTDIVFADRAVARAVAGPHPDNTRSCRAFEKAGFVAVRDVVVPAEGPERVYVRERGD
ncbi:MAG: GNAT family N-acetyltransferase [Acidimicrobiia bacterium]